MGSEWKEHRLKEITTLIVDCPHSTPEWTESGVIVLRNQNIRNGKLNLSSPSYTTEEGYQTRIKRAAPQSGDLVLTREAPMGEICEIPPYLKCCLGQRMVLVRANDHIVNSRFLLYSIQSPYVQNQIRWNEGTGSTVSNIRIPNIEDFRIPLPLLSEQIAIAEILGSLDDKIELNRKTNETLEAIARTLFKSWFIDFDPVHAKARGEQPPGMDAETAALFPDEFEDGIPKGWKRGTLSSVIEIIGGGTPKTAIIEYWEGDIPWFSVQDVPNGSDVFVMDTEKHISREALNSSSTKLLPEGTTIITARGTVGKCALVGVPMAMNQSCYGVRSSLGDFPFFTYNIVKNSVIDLQQNTHGSVFDTITRSTFDGIQTVIPDAYVIEQYELQAIDYYELIKSNLVESESLKVIRDTLLPKMISGEIRVPEAEEIAEAAV